LAEIYPFHGAHYNQSQVKDLAKVICPPYDIITPQIQYELYQRSESNFVRLEFGRELIGDKESDNKYTRALITLGKWLEQGIIEVDKTPAIYIHDHHFEYKGSRYRRRSFTCVVKLEEWSKMVVRPHEGTLSRPRSDRLSLLYTLKANTSPVLALYEDQSGNIATLFEPHTRGEPVLSGYIENGDEHHLWSITEQEVIDQICTQLANQPLYIADGHHRYESALAYQREKHSVASSAPGQASFDFVMMTLVSFDDPGLIILPAHRLVHGLSKLTLDSLIAGLSTFFTLAEVPLDKANISRQVDDLLSENTGEVKLIMYGLEEEQLLVLKLSDTSTVRPMIPYFHSELYEKLDVSIVDHVILEELLGLTHDAAGISIAYSNDALEAVNSVLEKEYQLAFIVNPVRPGLIKAIADSGDRMPRKSTYFYPKMPAGLVFYRFE